MILVRVAPLALVVFSAAGNAQSNPLPLKHMPKPTSAAISEADLMTRLYLFADDSMMGRQFGREGNMKGTAYIARELARLGVEPAGDSGTYFQSLPVVVRKFTDKSTLAVDGKPLRWEADFVAVPARAPRLFTSAQVLYGGGVTDTANAITREQAAGKVVVFTMPSAGSFSPQQLNAVANRNAGRLAQAAGFALVDLQNLNASQRAFVNNPQGTLTLPGSQAPTPTPVILRITPEAAEIMLGKPLADLAPGASGRTLTASLDFVEQARPEYGRNVIGIIRGRDPALRGQYVALGAHNDHVGFSATPIEHDSTRNVLTRAQVMSFIGKDTIRALTPDQRRAITVNVDSLRRLRPARLDSIRNGADDDGSGSMALLEVAEAVSKMSTKPRRSILFVWHTGEEAGLQGASYFTANPTVPKDSIVVQLNVDMIGRGRSDDIPGGSPDFLGVVGSSFISNDLGEAVRTVNARQRKPLQLDYRFDADVSTTLGPAYNNIYRRSDHFRYAQIGIPIAFFFTGLHADYHQYTDEPQYIDYPHYARITQYLNDLALEIANRDKRPAITNATP